MALPSILYVQETTALDGNCSLAVASSAYSVGIYSVQLVWHCSVILKTDDLQLNLF